MLMIVYALLFRGYPRLAVALTQTICLFGQFALTLWIIKVSSYNAGWWSCLIITWISSFGGLL